MYVSFFLIQGTQIYNADGEPVPGTSHVLLADATVRFLSKKHLPFAIISFLVLGFTFLPPLLLIFYPCKVFKRCLNCCHNRRWHALHTFAETFQGCYKDGVTGGWDLRSMSGVYLLFRYVLILANYHIVPQIGWLLRTVMFLGLSILILIVQPYKKSYMNVLDALLLALLGFLTLLIVTFEFLLPSAYEILPAIFVIACGVPQLVLLLSVAYRQLKGRQAVEYIAGKVKTLLKQMKKQNQAEDEPSDADSLPHRLVSPNQYDRSLLSESEQAHANSKTLSMLGQVPHVCTYGSIS